MCCDLQLNLSDYCDKYGIICGRTMEFREPLNSKLTIIPRGKLFRSVTPVNTLEWINKYGFVGIKVINTNIIVDGMNEVGLSCGILTLDDTQYEEISGISISILDICAWVLGTCSTVNDAINKLTTVKVWGEVVPILNRIIGLHIVIHDSDGNNIVCELFDSQKKFYINNQLNIEKKLLLKSHYLNIYTTDGVVTNGPYYPKQLDILNKYRKSQPIIYNNLSSITRFIKLSELKRLCIPNSYDAIGLINLVCHIFNNVDIIKGVSNNYNYSDPHEITQWCLIKDLTSIDIYFRSYNNMTLRRLRLGTLDFSGITVYPDIPLDDIHPTILDINL